jgi:trimeric autotransporter adhesin
VNNGSGSVSVIASATNTMTASIPVGSAPLGVAVTPDGSKVYVANYSSNSVSVIATATDTVTHSPIAVENGPIAFGLFIQPVVALTVAETGSGSGTVTSSPAGIACGPTCSYAIAVGWPVTLTASAAAGSVFSGWTDAACSSIGTNPCTLTLEADTTVIASFAQIPSYMLTVSLAGNGSGTVASVPSGISCGSMCARAS